VKIKPCPFCGGKDSSRREASGGGYFRECYHCNAKGPWRADAGEADTVWNHSVTAALTKERDEALFALEQRRENMDKIFVEREQMQARIAAVVAAYDHSALVPMHHAISKLRATLTGGKETK